MSTRPSTGRRIRKDDDEMDVFDHRREIVPRAGQAKAANRRDRRAARQGRSTE
ncbi:hypothetical protein [Haloechinothrix halophila]|uniref:hypothetical protein n=1 Tax=Haloechinothrix halophila TaxID=1069073 RepID=UPI00040B0D99|nr:hypothetical protein [Haloechinothrix halophila]